MAQTYQGVSECVLTDSETLNDAKIRAKLLAEQDAREKVAEYVKSFTQNRNLTFSDDEIATVTDSVIKFVDIRYGKAIIQAYVTAQLDDNDISAWLNKYSQEKTALVAQNEDFKRQIEELKLRNAELEKKLAEYQPKTETQTPKHESKLQTPKKDNISVENEAWKLFCLGDYSGAIKFYNEAIKQHPNVANFYFYRGKCYENLREIKKANEDFKKYDKLRG